MNDRQIGVYMTFNLLKQGYEWGTALTGMNNQRMKYKFQIAMNANRNLIDEMESELAKEDPMHNERFWEDSAYFSKVLEIIRKAETPEKKQELILIMRSFLDGELKIQEN